MYIDLYFDAFTKKVIFINLCSELLVQNCFCVCVCV